MRRSNPYFHKIFAFGLCLGVVGWAGVAEAIILRGGYVKAGGYYGGQTIQFAGEELLEPKNILGPAAGAGLEWSLKRRSSWTFLTEVIWAQKGVEADVPELDPSGNQIGTRTVTATANYLMIPIVAKLSSGEATGPYFLVGVSLDILLSTNDELYFEFLREVGMGAHAGIGIEWEINRNLAWFIEARYDQDVTDSFNGPKPNQFNIESVRNRGGLVFVGLRF